MKLVSRIAAASLLTIAVDASCQAPLVITGTATYREWLPAPSREDKVLPQDAVFEATLVDVSRSERDAEVIRTIRIERPGKRPIHFSIAFVPQRIEETHTYTVRARIVVNRRTMFATWGKYPVITKGHGNEVKLELMSTRPSGGPAPTIPAEPLRETYWKLTELEGKPVTAADQQQEAHLVFRTNDSNISGSGGCNRLMGSYTVAGDVMHFKGVASTMMACLHGMETEQTFVGALNKVQSWKIIGSHLELYDESGTLLMKFEARALK